MPSDDARLNPEDVQYVNAHATSTDLGDRAETIAMKRCFGDACGQAGGQLDEVHDGTSARRRRRRRGDFLHVWQLGIRWRPPTINLDNPGEGCDLDYVPNTARSMPMRAALSNSFGFGGTNGSLIFRTLE